MAVIRTKLETASVAEQSAIVAALADNAREQCARDLHFFLRFVKTRDETDPNQPVKPFPMQLDYVRRLMDVFHADQRVAVAKSRQLMVSWCVCAYMVFHARFTPHRHAILQTQNWDDALKMVSMPGASKDGGWAGRCQFIEAHLPSWLKQNITISEGKISYPNGSMIEALPGGANKVRGKTPSLIALDEAAFLEEAGATYTAIAPLLKGATKLFVVSTPNGGAGNVFYSLYHGLPLDGQAA